MKNEFFVGLVNKLEGYHTRLKELHYSSPSYSIHKLIDEFDGSLCEFEDSMVENATPLFGAIRCGELSPILPDECTNFNDVLESVRGNLAETKREFGENIMATGIINIVDDFFSEVNKYIYLNQVATHEFANTEE